MFMGDIIYTHGMEIYNDRFQDIIGLYQALMIDKRCSEVSHMMINFNQKDNSSETRKLLFSKGMYPFDS